MCVWVTRTVIMYSIFILVLLTVSETIGTREYEALHQGTRTAGQVNATVTTLRPETVTLPDFCQPFNEPTPNFRTPGRRISESKCEDYKWVLNVRLEKDRRDMKCTFYQLRLKNTFPTVIPYNPANHGDFPHMGAIGWKSAAPNGTWVFKCGSSLISEKFVLTAAHCTKASTIDKSISDPVPKIVRLGDKGILDSHNYYTVEVNIREIIVHPGYSPPKKYFDIALMELEQQVTFSKFIQPACLWNSFSTRQLGKEGTLTGWGVVESGSLKISPDLSSAIVDVFEKPKCNELLKNACNRNWCGMQDHQICAGKLKGGVDACQGDSGGPLQVKIPQRSTKEGQMHYVFGIISFGVGCALPNLPGIYTRVSSFIDWIEDNVWGNETLSEEIKRFR